MRESECRVVDVDAGPPRLFLQFVEERAVFQHFLQYQGCHAHGGAHYDAVDAADGPADARHHRHQHCGHQDPHLEKSESNSLFHFKIQSVDTVK